MATVAAVTFDLPMPLSVNNAYRNRVAADWFRNGKGNKARGRVLTAQHESWRSLCAQNILAQRATMETKRIDGPYILSIICSRKWKGDLGNAEKPISDLLVWMYVVDDDADAEEIHLRWGDVPGCRVTVSALNTLAPEAA